MMAENTAKTQLLGLGDIKSEDGDQTLNRSQGGISSEASKPKSDRKRGGPKKDFVSSILDQDHNNVIDFFENVDPMLAWAMLKSKILPQVGAFDLLAERSRYVNGIFLYLKLRIHD